MNLAIRLPLGLRELRSRLDLAKRTLKAPPVLSLIEWADTERRVAAKTSASPGRWKTNSQPCAFGPMAAIFDYDTNTVSVMAGTQVVKTEFLINVAAYYICQDPSSILFVQPSQGAAASFSKERFAPTIEVTPALRAVVEPPKARDSENTITHKNYRGGSLDFVGANSPTDLSSRPKRIILCDEIDKYPPSAGSEGDPLKLAEERASTYKAIGRAKFVRTCSPTVEGVSRIGREYAASDQRRLFVACPHCGDEQVLSWAHVRWDRDEEGNHLPDTASLSCLDCGAIWTEQERIRALNDLERKSDYGWRQTRKFSCCGVEQKPSKWNEKGRSLCTKCGTPSKFGGHAGFHVSKLYSKRHRIPEIVREFLEAKVDPELLRKWTNTALAELWTPKYTQTFDPAHLISRAETYGPDDLPEAVAVVTGFCDVQDDRLEVQFVGWGADEECWPFKYDIIYLDPAQPAAWKALDVLISEIFYTVSRRPLRVAGFGIDTGGHQADQVYAFCDARRGRRIFACKGAAGARPIWPGKPSKSKKGSNVYLLGVDAAKDAIYARLNIDPPVEQDYRKPGFIHFPVGDNFGPEYYEQLNSERRERKKRLGQTIVAWVQIRDRNEALDTLVGALAMRKSLPRKIEVGLEYATRPQREEQEPVAGQELAVAGEDVHEAYKTRSRLVQRQGKQSWMGSRRRRWLAKD
jgi:phage terminase large subunit GpA-like protein